MGIFDWIFGKKHKKSEVPEGQKVQPEKQPSTLSTHAPLSLAASQSPDPSDVLLDAAIRSFQDALDAWLDTVTATRKPFAAVVTQIAPLTTSGKHRLKALLLGAEACWFGGMYDTALANLDELVLCCPHGVPGFMTAHTPPRTQRHDLCETWPLCRGRARPTASSRRAQEQPGALRRMHREDQPVFLGSRG